MKDFSISRTSVLFFALLSILLAATIADALVVQKQLPKLGAFDGAHVENIGGVPTLLRNTESRNVRHRGDDDDNEHGGSQVGSTENCNEAQIHQVLDAYELGGEGDFDAQTGYDFSGAYPFFNDTEADSFLFQLIDTYDTVGKAAFIATLESYPPWVNKIFGTTVSFTPWLRIVDAQNCLAYLLIDRNLTDYATGNELREFNDVKLFFGNNRRNGRNGGNRPYRYNGNRAPDVLVNKIVEMPNGYTLLSSLFTYADDTPTEFCTKYMQRCGYFGLGDWNTVQECVAYTSQTPYSNHPLYPENFVPLPGDTQSCRNNMMARRISDEIKFGSGPQALAGGCYIMGPDDGAPGRVCSNTFGQ